MTLPLHNQRFDLSLVGVLLQCLDSEQKPLPGVFASGFVRKESEGHFLYTCWHVVTGFDPNDVRVGFELPKRQYLQVSLQASDQSHPGVERIGGIQTFVLPLYEVIEDSRRPLWHQDDAHIFHPDLNAIGLYVPFWHDVVKLRLPDDMVVSDDQLIDEERIFRGNTPIITPGDKCIVVGYPYGYSAFGPGQPTPVALTRFIASNRIGGRIQQFLLDGIAAPGMSGGPVYIERDENLLLLGIYTGSIYPDAGRSQRDRATDLGTVSNLSLLLWNRLKLVKTPSKPHTRGA